MNELNHVKCVFQTTFHLGVYPLYFVLKVVIHITHSIQQQIQYQMTINYYCVIAKSKLNAFPMNIIIKDI